jgi:hypothetical protein
MKHAVAKKNRDKTNVKKKGKKEGENIKGRKGNKKRNTKR